MHWCNLSNTDIFSCGHVEHLPFTDHAMVFSAFDTMDMPLHQSPRFVSRRRWFSSSNQKDQLENALMQTMDRLEASGIDGMWEEWKLKFLEALDQVAPVVTTGISIKKVFVSMDGTRITERHSQAKICISQAGHQGGREELWYCKTASVATEQIKYALQAIEEWIFQKTNQRVETIAKRVVEYPKSTWQAINYDDMFPQCPCHCWQITLSHSFAIRVLSASCLAVQSANSHSVNSN